MGSIPILCTMTDNQKRDYELYFLPEGDPGFSPQKNKATIDSSIKKYEAQRRAKLDKVIDQYGERADAVITFLKSIERGGSTSNIEKYFSKQTLAALRGDEIRNEIMANLEIRTKDGIIVKRRGQEVPYASPK